MTALSHRRRTYHRRVSVAKPLWGVKVTAEVGRACSASPMVILKDRLRVIRPAMVRNLEYSMSLFQRSIADHHSHLTDAGLADQVSEDTLKSFRTHLERGNGPRSVHDHLERLLIVARRIRPAFDITPILNEQALIDLPQRKKVVPSITAAFIWHTGQKLMTDAERRLDKTSCVPCRPGFAERTGEIFRDGLMLCMMALCAIRVRNVVQMRIGHHLTPAEATYRIYFSDGETKHKRVITGLLPVCLGRRVDEYLRSFRPLIRHASSHDHFWASRAGGGLTYIGIYQIVRRTFSRQGRTASPHDIRRAAVNALVGAGSVPGDLAQSLLGHSMWSTTEIYITERRRRAEGLLQVLTTC